MYEGSGWWKGEPEIVDGAIRLKKNAKGVTFYRFFTGVTEEADPIMPHRALIGLQTVEDALEFVKEYGLLGLWKCKPYASTGVNFYVNHLDGEIDFYTQWQEPIPLFMSAVREFQEIAEALLGAETPKREAVMWLEEWISECHPTTVGVKSGVFKPAWHCPSLLHACYLGLWFDLTEGRIIRRCAHKYCDRLFYADRPNKLFCSEECRNKANRLKHYYRQKEKASS